MHHHPVKSSRIHSVAYDESSGILEIRFRDNKTLQYPASRRAFSATFSRWFLKAVFTTA
jgi:hypothetical protein